MEKKLTGYNIINLKEMISAYMEYHDGNASIAEHEVKEILSTFSCHYNKDVDDFLHNKAIEFSKQGIANTHLVVSNFKDEVVIVGYFALAQKYFLLDKNSVSKTLRKKVSKFGKYDREIKKYIIPAPLIGQLGKNKNGGINNLITGDELLKIACEYIESVFFILGGKVIYLECEDIDSLLSFYESNGFVKFGERKRDSDEEGLIKTTQLVQLLKIL